MIHAPVQTACPCFLSIYRRPDCHWPDWNCVFFLSLLPRILQVEDKLQKADYILPLAGDWHRLIKAAELHKEGFAPMVLLSNSRVRPPSRLNVLREEMGIEQIPQRAFRKRMLPHLGVPENSLKEFGDGYVSTAEEAEAFRSFIKTQKIISLGKPSWRVILVTSPYHTRRARMIFDAAMPDIQFLVTSPPEGRLKAQWWRDQRSAQLAVLEGFKFAFYLLGGRFRSHVE
jgi:uncharacterized SAM-binding protein YcdF (DUF218 family)